MDNNEVHTMPDGLKRLKDCDKLTIDVMNLTVNPNPKPQPPNLQGLRHDHDRRHASHGPKARTPRPRPWTRTPNIFFVVTTRSLEMTSSRYTCTTSRQCLPIPPIRLVCVVYPVTRSSLTSMVNPKPQSAASSSSSSSSSSSFSSALRYP